MYLVNFKTFDDNHRCLYNDDYFETLEYLPDTKDCYHYENNIYICTYDNLVELILDSNKFKRLPKCIGKLKKLTRLSICNNMINDIKNVYHLKKLKFLILDNNNLSELDEKLKNLEKLEVLHLNHNSITQLYSNLLKHSLNNLKQLDFLHAVQLY